jgi:hypothetical protein
LGIRVRIVGIGEVQVGVRIGILFVFGVEIVYFIVVYFMIVSAMVVYFMIVSAMVFTVFIFYIKAELFILLLGNCYVGKCLMVLN